MRIELTEAEYHEAVKRWRDNYNPHAVVVLPPERKRTMKLPAYAKAIAAAIGGAVAGVLPFIHDARWDGILGGAITLLAVILGPANAKAGNAPDSPPAAK